MQQLKQKYRNSEFDSLPLTNFNIIFFNKKNKVQGTVLFLIVSMYINCATLFSFNKLGVTLEKRLTLGQHLNSKRSYKQ